MTSRMTTYPITRRVNHGPEITTVCVENAPEANPGQFFLVWLPGIDEKPISVAWQDHGETGLTICGIGPWSRAMLRCEPGTRIGLRGPFGKGFAPLGRGLIVGGGMGIAPLFYLAQRLMEEGHEFDLALGARSADRLLYVEAFARWGAHLATDDGSLGEESTVVDVASRLLKLGQYDSLYACGPEPMLTALWALARAHDLPVQFALERYMKCGIGLCGQCCVDGIGLRVCVEGPVFNDVMLDEMTAFGQPHRGPDGRRP